MKAPDKIYCGNNGHGNLSYSTEKIYPSMEEYIRKDSLLEWAKEQKEAIEELIKEHPKDDSLWAEMHWYEQLIKHIESL